MTQVGCSRMSIGDVQQTRSCIICTGSLVSRAYTCKLQPLLGAVALSGRRDNVPKVD